MLGWLLYCRGEWRKAREWLTRAIRVSSSADPAWFKKYALLQYGRLQAATGAEDEAIGRIEDALAMAEESGDVQALQMGHQLLARLDLEDGRYDAVVERLRPLTASVPLPALVDVLSTLAYAELELGMIDSASAALVRASDLCKRLRFRLPLPGVRCVEGVVFDRREKREAADRAFQRAVSVARSMPYPYAEALVRHERGVIQARRGEKRRAALGFRKALTIFRRLGAAPAADRTAQELDNLGPDESVAYGKRGPMNRARAKNEAR
jgi:tetratricopeptide (TPR) repeat protein